MSKVGRGQRALAADGSLRTLVRFAVPLMLSGAITVVVSANDTILVGRFGAPAVAAVTTASSVYLVLVLGLAGLGVAVQILVARARGAGEPDRVAYLGAVSLLIAVAGGTVAAATLFVAAPWLVDVVAADTIDEELAATYLRVLALALPLVAASAVLRGFATGCGETATVLRASLGLATADIAVAIGLLAGGGGPLSVAVSTVVGMAAGTTAYLLWLRRRARTGEAVPARPPRSLLRPLSAEVTRLAWPEVVAMVASAGAGVVVVFVLSPAGEVALAAARWLDIVGLVAWIVLYAVGAALTTQIATAFGSGDAELTRRQARTALRVTMTLALGLTTLVAVSAGPLARLAIDDPAVAVAVGGVALAGGAQALWMALTVVANGVVRGHGDTRTPLRASLVAEYAVFLPLGWLLCRHLDLGLVGVFVAHHAFWATFAAIAGSRALRMLRSTDPGDRIAGTTVSQPPAPGS